MKINIISPTILLRKTTFYYTTYTTHKQKKEYAGSDIRTMRETDRLLTAPLYKTTIHNS
jgi:hypothetical protein